MRNAETNARTGRREEDQTMGPRSWLVRAQVHQPVEPVSARRHLHQEQAGHFYRDEEARGVAYRESMGRAASIARAGDARGLD